jgi:hypothetical protein
MNKNLPKIIAIAVIATLGVAAFIFAKNKIGKILTTAPTPTED